VTSKHQRSFAQIGTEQRPLKPLPPSSTTELNIVVLVSYQESSYGRGTRELLISHEFPPTLNLDNIPHQPESQPPEINSRPFSRLIYEYLDKFHGRRALDYSCPTIFPIREISLLQHNYRTYAPTISYNYALQETV